jgi:hypothetical protein
METFMMGKMASAVVLGVVGSVLGTTVAFAGPQGPFAASPKVVTLGDSYSSGTGIWNSGSSYDEELGGTQAGLKLTSRADDQCWRETDSTPGPRRAVSTGAASIFLACKGAEVAHVANQVTLLQQIDAADATNFWAGSTFLLTAGGNDIRSADGSDWPTIIERCVTEADLFGGCHDKAKNQVPETGAGSWSNVQAKLTDLYNDLAAKASGAKIRVMGYPRLMTPSRNWLGLTVCPGLVTITGNEAKWVDQRVDRLNQAVASAVAAAKAVRPNVDIKFVSTNDRFAGACAISGYGINGYILTGGGNASFHPNQRGFDGIGAAFATSL